MRRTVAPRPSRIVSLSSMIRMRAIGRSASPSRNEGTQDSLSCVTGGKTDPAQALGLVRAAIRAMRGYSPGEQSHEAVKLNTNEGAYPPAPAVMAALAAISEEKVRLYPDPTSRLLREAA